MNRRSTDGSKQCPYSLQSLRNNGDYIRLDFEGPSDLGVERIRGTLRFVRPDGGPRSSLFEFEASLRAEGGSYDQVFKLQQAFWEELKAGK